MYINYTVPSSKGEVLKRVLCTEDVNLFKCWHWGRKW